MQLDEYRLHGNADRISTGNIEIPSHIQIWPNKNGHKKIFHNYQRSKNDPKPQKLQKLQKLQKNR